MKKFMMVAAIALMAISTTANAQEFDDIQVDIISWCDGTRVVGYDSNNAVVTKYDCAARGEQCRQYQITRFNWIQHIASCSAN